MEILLLAILALGTLWNAFTIVYGAVSILGNGILEIIASLLFSALVLGFVLNTTRIIKSRSGFIGGLLALFWFISVCYNFYASWIGNSLLMGSDQASGAETALLIGLTLLGASSPILLSVLWGRRYRTEQPVRETSVVDQAHL